MSFHDDIVDQIYCYPKSYLGISDRQIYDVYITEEGIKNQELLAYLHKDKLLRMKNYKMYKDEHLFCEPDLYFSTDSKIYFYKIISTYSLDLIEEGIYQLYKMNEWMNIYNSNLQDITTISMISPNDEYDTLEKTLSNLQYFTLYDIIIHELLNNNTTNTKWVN